MKKSKKPAAVQLSDIGAGRLRPPFAVVLGSPRETADLVVSLPSGEADCYQMDLHQAERLRQDVKEIGAQAEVVTAPDLWDLPPRYQTVIYPVPQGGERELKLGVVEQAFHVLRPGGVFVVLSPYEKDELFPQALKKVFGRVHAPMAGKNAVLWCQRDGERPRRRHEMTFHVRVDEATSLKFVSRPGTFSYGRFDFGARALTEIMDVNPGDRILDLGCGCGTNGILAAQQAGAEASVTFVDSNLRALALADLNARELGVARFDTIASSTLEEVPTAAYDLVLANPPYYAQLSIARRFIETGNRALKRDGRFYLVTRQTESILPILEEFFGDVQAAEQRGYVVFRTTEPRVRLPARAAD